MNPGRTTIRRSSTKSQAIAPVGGCPDRPFESDAFGPPQRLTTPSASSGGSMPITMGRPLQRSLLIAVEEPHPELGGEGGSPPEATDARRLTASLAALVWLSVVELSLDDLLTQVASLAVQAIPGAEGAVLTTTESDHPSTVVYSAPFLTAVEDLQNRLGEGPSVTAGTLGDTVRAGSLGGDLRWPRFGPRVSRLGIHSVLSLPLRRSDKVIGILTVYARGKIAFDERSEAVGQLFAAAAAISAQNALIAVQSQRIALRLQASLTGRSVVDQAIGILISRSGISAEEAFDRLRAVSQKEHIKLVRVAENVIRGAARRARHVHKDTD